MDTDDIGIAVELRDHLCFTVEFLRSGLEGFLGLVVGGGDSGLAGSSHRKAHGIIFLDRNPGVQLQIIGEIGNTEASLADDASDHVTLV